MGARLDHTGAFARAAADRLAFVGESFAVAVLCFVFLGLSVARFDLAGAAHLWGFFWMRLAAPDAVLRGPMIAIAAAAMGLFTLLAALVRWPKASRAFDPFPLPRAARLRMMERLT